MPRNAKNKITRQGAIYRVALAGICSALALLLVWLSVIARYGTLGFFAAAGIVLMVPLSKKYYLSAFFAYGVSAGLAFLVGDIASIIGYVVYFGPIALLIGIFANKNVKLFVSLPIIAVYTVGALALFYFVFGRVIVYYEALNDLKFWVVAVVGTAVLVAIDIVEWLAFRYIVPRVSNAIRDGENSENKQSNGINFEDDNDSPFEEFDTFIVPAKKYDREESGKDTDDIDNNGGEEK